MTVPLRAGDPTVVNVALGERSYDIMIGRGQLASLGQKIAALRPGGKAAVLAAAGRDSTCVTVAPGEGAKSFPIWQLVWEALISARIERADLVVALGGGV